MLHPTEALRVMDKGPSGDDEEAVATFRDFWGSKAETRRFKDGSVIVAVGTVRSLLRSRTHSRTLAQKMSMRSWSEWVGVCNSLAVALFPVRSYKSSICSKIVCSTSQREIQTNFAACNSFRLNRKPTNSG